MQLIYFWLTTCLSYFTVLTFWTQDFSCPFGKCCSPPPLSPVLASGTWVRICCTYGCWPLGHMLCSYPTLLSAKFMSADTELWFFQSVPPQFFIFVSKTWHLKAEHESKSFTLTPWYRCPLGSPGFWRSNAIHSNLFSSGRRMLPISTGVGVDGGRGFLDECSEMGICPSLTLFICFYWVHPICWIVSASAPWVCCSFSLLYYSMLETSGMLFLPRILSPQGREGAWFYLKLQS